MGSVVRRRLRRDVDDHDARRQGDRQAEERGRRAARDRPPGRRRVAIAIVRTVWTGAAHSSAPCSAAQPAEIDLDADLEQEQDHPEVGEQDELVVVGHVARRERRDQQPDREVADDRRHARAAGPASPRRPRPGARRRLRGSGAPSHPRTDRTVPLTVAEGEPTGPPSSAPKIRGYRAGQVRPTAPSRLRRTVRKEGPRPSTTRRRSSGAQPKLPLILRDRASSATGPAHSSASRSHPSRVPEGGSPALRPEARRPAGVPMVQGGHR